jgi:glutathione S-transferase
MAVVLYELAGADPAVRFSPHCWKTRMALAHKGLEAECRPWRFSDKEEIAFSGQGLVPVLIDEGEAVHDSWRIALFLEARYPTRPALFPGDDSAVAGFVNAWADTTLVPFIARTILLDIYGCLRPEDQGYFRETREKRFGATLEAVAADRATNLAGLDRALAPLRQVLKSQDFIAGAEPAYADYCVFGMFMWPRCVSGVTLLEESDPVYHWRERLLDRFDGMARKAPRVAGLG